MRFTHGCLVVSELSLLADDTRGEECRCPSGGVTSTASRGEGEMAVFDTVFHPPADGLDGGGVW